jgi:hypothetical protein
VTEVYVDKREIETLLLLLGIPYQCVHCARLVVRACGEGGGVQGVGQGSEAIEFDSVSGQFSGITTGHIARWQAVFPGVSIEADILQAAAYYKTHPERMGQGKAETRLLAWFKRSQKGEQAETSASVIRDVPAIARTVQTKAFKFASTDTRPADSATRFTPPAENAVDVPLMDCGVDWQAVLPVLKDRLNDSDAYTKYIEPLIYLGDLSAPDFSNPDRRAMLFRVPDQYTRNHIRYNLGPYIADAVNDVMGKPFGLAFKVVN